ncbi:MAG: AAA family ATPase [Planctomycetota bacterium]
MKRPLGKGPTPGPYIEKVFMDRSRIQDPNHYAFQIPAIEKFEQLELHPKVTFFVGDNGSGKSTLLEAIAVANGLNAEGGSRNVQFSTRASHSQLHEALRMRRYHALIPDAWFLRAESLYNVATEIEQLDLQESNSRKLIDSYGGKSLHEQSHGESFLAIMSNRFSGGLYLLDEPEAALSPQRQLAFLSLLDAWVQKGSQLIIATHSPILLGYPNSWIYSFSEDGVKRVQYLDTDHYRLTKQFLDAPQRMLKHLLQGDASEMD